MPSYKVKSPIAWEPTQAPKKSAARNLKPGDSIELTEDEAFDIGHALEEPPETKGGAEVEEQLPPEVIASLKGNPEHHMSGIELYWKTRPDLSVRPEENKSNLEKALEPERAKGEAESKAHQEKVGRPGMPPRPAPPIEPGRPARPTPTSPVVPPGARPQPEKK